MSAKYELVHKGKTTSEKIRRLKKGKGKLHRQLDAEATETAKGKPKLMITFHYEVEPKKPSLKQFSLFN